MLEKLEREAQKKERRYWRVGTSDDNGNYWDRMKINNYASIGWSDLGDLTEDGLQKKDIVEMMTDIGYYDGNKGTISRKAGEIYNFLRVIKPGDIILAQDGTKVLGIGIVEDEEVGYQEAEIFPHYRSVDWKVIEPENFYSEDGKLTTVFEVSDKKTIALANELLGLTGSNIKSKDMLNHPRNIILYGPPGTGKTYHSLDLAVKLANGISSTDHGENKKEFDKLRKEGQIEFVTFHQNYTYEDFMVGIRPDTDSPILRFNPYKGLFYQLCKRARDNYEAFKSGSSLKTYEEIIDDLLLQITEEQPLELKTIKGKPFWVTGGSDTTLFLKKSTGNESHTLSISTLIDIAEGKREIVSGLNVYYRPLIEYLNKSRQSSNQQEMLKNFVLIIDEINRANISKVFGELITLLEEDKRIDGHNELRVTLPNGEKDFVLPPNLYVVGTMNTADKSIALIDIALRRRFEFIGKYPNYEILQETSPEAAALLKSINAAVYRKKNSPDYLIGHAYFLKHSSIADILTTKVIPLLMEYFSSKTDVVSEIFWETKWKVKYNIESFSWEITENLS